MSYTSGGVRAMPPRPIATYDYRNELSGGTPYAAGAFCDSLVPGRSIAEELSGAALLYAAINDTRAAGQVFSDEEARGITSRDRVGFRRLQDLYLDGEDLHITYDGETNAALEADTVYRVLLARSQDSSVVSEYSVDQLRLHRIVFFLECVIDYQVAGGEEPVFYTT
jgi:hypothetical protein